MNRLRTRPEYQAAAKGARVARPAFVLQAIRREDEGGPARFGFTASRRVGNAVLRNRVRRRLRELARIAGREAAPGMDFVLIGRPEAANRPFPAMARDLATALAEAAAAPARRRRARSVEAG